MGRRELSFFFIPLGSVWEFIKEWNGMEWSLKEWNGIEWNEFSRE